MTDGHGHPSESLIEFRLSKLEEAVASLSTLKDIVLKWDARFSESGNFPLQCNLHRERMEQFDKRLETVENNVEELKGFMYKMTGALVVISIAIQLVGPLVLDHFKEHAKPTATQSDSSGGYWAPAKTNDPYHF